MPSIDAARFARPAPAPRPPVNAVTSRPFPFDRDASLGHPTEPSMIHSFRSVVLVVVSVLLAGAVARAQGTAQLNGTVTDESGAVLPGVTVTVTQTDTGVTRTVVTDDNGVVRDAEPADSVRTARGVAAGFPHLRADRHRAAGRRHADDQRRRWPSATSRRRSRSKRRRRSSTCAAPASARSSSRSGSWSCRCRDARSPT